MRGVQDGCSDARGWEGLREGRLRRPPKAGKVWERVGGTKGAPQWSGWSGTG